MVLGIVFVSYIVQKYAFFHFRICNQVTIVVFMFDRLLLGAYEIQTSCTRKCYTILNLAVYWIWIQWGM